MLRTLFLASLVIASAGVAYGQTKAPRPQFQKDFFGEMPRAFAIVLKADEAAHTLTVKIEKDGRTVTLPIKADTELRFRDSWGELGDYFPGQRVMLFMYIDDERNWTYPRAVQDDIQVAALHNWFAAVTRIDTDKGTCATHREEKNSQGEVTKVVDAEFHFDPAAKVWKGEQPGGIDSLRVGDEVVQQLVERDGQLVAVEILDRAGVKAIHATQDARHREHEDTFGLPAYVNDLEPLSGSLLMSIAWSSSARGKQLKPGDIVAIQPTGTGKPFGAVICSLQGVDSRQRIQAAVNSRVSVRLSIGQALSVFLPGTGPDVPKDRAGAPGNTPD